MAGALLVALAVAATVAAELVALTSGPAAPAGVPGVPAAMVVRYRAAAATCPGLPWTLLEAIGTVESGNGTSALPGVHAGANPAGAEGPMQMEPSTFAAYDHPVPPGGAAPPSPYDPTDAVYAAARMLCADGAARPSTRAAAVWDYNHSAAYVQRVLALAAAIAAATTGGAPVSGAGGVALAWALRQLGVPYRWGGTTAATGFDCSGLTQAAWAAAGVRLPRTAQQQWEAGPALPVGSPLQPGDLVFFGSLPGTAEHVGMVVGAAHGVTEMVDAPHTGASVRIEPFPTTIGAAWGDEVLLGATAP